MATLLKIERKTPEKPLVIGSIYLCHFTIPEDFSSKEPLHVRIQTFLTQIQLFKTFPENLGTLYWNFGPATEQPRDKPRLYLSYYGKKTHAMQGSFLRNRIKNFLEQHRVLAITNPNSLLEEKSELPLEDYFKLLHRS